MAIDSNKDYSLTGAQIEDLAGIVNNKVNCSSLADIAFSGSYNDLSDIPAPEKEVIRLFVEIDNNFPTVGNSASVLVYKDENKTEPYTPEEIGDALSNGRIPELVFLYTGQQLPPAIVETTMDWGSFEIFFLSPMRKDNGGGTSWISANPVRYVLSGGFGQPQDPTDITLGAETANFTAASSGTVPPSQTQGQNKILRGDATWTDDYVTRTTNQNNITGEKTFVGDKRIKFKGSAANSKMGFTCYDNSNKEVGFLEATNTSGVKTNILGIWDTESNTTPNRLGFQYKKQGDSKGYNLLVPPKYPLNNTNADLYMTMGVSDGTNTVLPDSTGVVDISSILPSGGGNILYIDSLTVNKSSQFSVPAVVYSDANFSNPITPTDFMAIAKTGPVLLVDQYGSMALTLTGAPDSDDGSSVMRYKFVSTVEETSSNIDRTSFGVLVADDNQGSFRIEIYSMSSNYFYIQDPEDFDSQTIRTLRHPGGYTVASTDIATNLFRYSASYIYIVPAGSTARPTAIKEVAQVCAMKNVGAPQQQAVMTLLTSSGIRNYTESSNYGVWNLT